MSLSANLNEIINKMGIWSITYENFSNKHFWAYYIHEHFKY
jgi:hypothetical protein